MMKGRDMLDFIAEKIWGLLNLRSIQFQCCQAWDLGLNIYLGIGLALTDFSPGLIETKLKNFSNFHILSTPI